MIEVTVAEAQQRLPELLDRVQGGESVAIVKDGMTYRLWVGRPRPMRPRPPVTGVPRAGSCKGLFVVPPDFKEPLEELREYME